HAVPSQQDGCGFCCERSAKRLRISLQSDLGGRRFVFTQPRKIACHHGVAVPFEIAHDIFPAPTAMPSTMYKMDHHLSVPPVRLRSSQAIIIGLYDPRGSLPLIAT